MLVDIASSKRDNKACLCHSPASPKGSLFDSTFPQRALLNTPLPLFFLSNFFHSFLTLFVFSLLLGFDNKLSITYNLSSYSINLESSSYILLLTLDSAAVWWLSTMTGPSEGTFFPPDFLNKEFLSNFSAPNNDSKVLEWGRRNLNSGP